MAIQIDLTLLEFQLALQTAGLRMVASDAQRLNHSTTYQRNYMKRLVEEVAGACGELAFGKACNKWFVPGLNTFHNKPDYMFNIEVRSTDNANGSLIIRQNDAVDRRYVMAVVEAPRVTLVGWMLGSDARQGKYLRNPHNYREAWFVPQSDLNSLDGDLADWLRSPFDSAITTHSN